VPRTQLWDVCEDQEAVDLVRFMQDAQAMAKKLLDHALAKFSTDNVTVVVVRLRLGINEGSSMTVVSNGSGNGNGAVSGDGKA
jgi:serine/threonine protein phosphatase PrpC